MAEHIDSGASSRQPTRHRFVRTLGNGRFAEVTAVLRQGPAGFKRMVALKRPHAEGPGVVERLLREARIGGLLRHEAIVATLDVERDEAGWYLVLEYVDGPTLGAVLASGAPPIPVGAAFTLGRELCAGLQYAHAAVDEAGRPLGLVHGDLSPANVLLTRKGQVKIADFGGAASALDPEDRGAGRGTPGFAAPEVSRREPLDARADVFSAGAILRALFARTELRDDPRLAAIFARATASDRSERTADIATLDGALAALRPTTSGEPALAVLAAGWVERLATLPSDEREEVAALPARPYRGLESFGPESAALFFGRDDDAARIARRIRSSPLTVLTGASGAGKSSVLAAGLPRHLPELAVLRFRPGPDPVTRLARLLGVPREELAGVAEGAAATPTLLILDQAEELLTLASPAGANEVTAALAALAEAGHARVLFSVRADHLAALCDLEPLRGKAGAAVELLSLPSRQQLVDALMKPLEPFGVRFESPALVDRIVSGLVGRPGALALLQFCADRLWEARDVERGVLREADLDALGGIDGAITTYADRTLESLGPAEQTVARQILVRCLQGGARHPLGVPALLAADWAGPHAAEVLDRLVEARLLTRRADPEEGAVVEPAHEALVAHWQRLGRWVTQDTLAHQVLGELIRAAARWERAGQPDELLWTGRLLSQWVVLEPDLAEHLGPDERRFIDACVGQSRRQRRVRVAVVTAVCVVSAALALLATLGWRQAAGAREEAETARRASEIDARLSKAAHHRERGETGAAVALAREVLRVEPRSARALSELYAAVGGRPERAILTGHGDAVREAAFTPDGAHVVTVGMDGRVRIWDAAGHLERTLDPQLGPTYRVRVSPKGDRFSVVGAAKTGRIYSLDGGLDGALIAELDVGEQPALVAWDPTGERLIVTGVEGKAALFNASGGLIGELATGSTGLGWVEFSALGDKLVYVGTGAGPGKVFAADGRALTSFAHEPSAVLAGLGRDDHILTASWPGIVQLFGADGRELARVDGRGRYPVAAWAPDGSRFVAGSPDDEGALTVRAADGGVLYTLAGHRAPIHAVAYGVGGVVASADEQGEIRVFSATGETIAVLAGHLGRVWSLAFSADGSRLVSAAEDGTARLWDTRGRARARLAAGRRVELCPIDATGERVLTLARDHQAGWTEVTMYSAGGDGLATWRAEGEAAIEDLRWRHDGREAVALRQDGGLVWLGRDGDELGRLTPRSPVRVLQWHGQRLLGGTEDGHVVALTRAGDEPRVAVSGRPIAALAARDERRGAAASELGLALYDLETKQVVALDPRPGVRALCWSPDGERLVAGREDGSAELRDAEGRVIAALEGHRERVVHCAWHPGSGRVATAAWDGDARIWGRDGALIEVVGGHKREVQTATWSPDGARFLTTDWSGTAWLRDERGVLATLSGHGGEVVRATWATAAPVIATCARNGREVRLWPADDDELRRWAEALVPEARTWRD